MPASNSARRCRWDQLEDSRARSSARKRPADLTAREHDHCQARLRFPAQLVRALKGVLGAVQVAARQRRSPRMRLPSPTA